MSKGAQLEPNSQLGPYKIVRLLARGGMGEVYEAFEEALHRKIALKVASPEIADQPEIMERFQREGRALARINHPNVVIVHSLSRDQNISYIAMEFVEGTPLDERIKGRVLSLKVAVPLMSQMLNGTRALHEAGIIHRDLKPKNIIYRKDHNIKIVDLGVVKLTMEAEDLTLMGTVIGSIFYLSPEVARGKPATIQSDIWSLGVIFYEMLVGKRPFDGENSLAVLDQIKNRPLTFPRQTRLPIPEGMKRIILKMCEKEMDRRYHSVSEIQDDVHRLMIQESVGSQSLDQALEAITNAFEVKGMLQEAGIDNTEAKWVLGAAIEGQQKVNVLSGQTSLVSQALTISPPVLQKAIEEFHLNRADSMKLPEVKYTTTNIAMRVERERSRPSHLMVHESSSPNFFLWLIVAVGLGFGGWYYWKKAPVETAENPSIETIPIPDGSPIPLPPTQLPAKNETPIPPPTQAQNPPPPPPVALKLPQKIEKVDEPDFTKDEPVPQEPQEVVGDSRSSKKAVKLGAPELFKDKQLVTLSFGGGNLREMASAQRAIRNLPKLKWRRVAQAQKYEIQLSEDPTFKNFLIKDSYKELEYLWKSPEPGVFYWRVRGMKNGAYGPYSRTGSVRVILPAPVLQSSYTKTEKVINPDDMKNSNHSLKIDFPAVPMAASYKILISPTRNFASTPQEVVSKDEHFEISPNEGREVFVKVAAMNSKGMLSSHYSSPARVKYTRSLDLLTPSPKLPTSGQSVKVEKGGAVHFEWDEIRYANQYRLEISFDKDFKKLHLYRNVAIPKFYLNRDFPKGTVYWRVRAERGEFQSPWSDTRTLNF